MKRLLLLILMMTSCTCFANRIYVNALAVDSNNGTSWANAYTSLKTGIEVAETGDTVLVAAGVYRNLTSSGLFTYRFYKGIILLGGYPNTGNPTDAQRNWVNHPTILSGEAGTNGHTDNVLLVTNLATPVVIDGFILRRSGTTGLKIENSSAVVVKNTVFENNWGQTIYISNSSVTFTNCVIYNNQSVPVYNNSNASASFYNCVIAGNDGYSSVFRNENASLAIYNCTLANNKGIAVSGNGTGTTVIKNSIFRDNRYDDKLVNADIRSFNHTFQVSHCITQTYYISNTPFLLVNQHPRFLNQLQPAGADNKFFTADDGLQLTAPCSPALNCGDNSPLSAITSDIIGNPRIYNGGIVDLGAYEMQQTPGAYLKTVYVNGSAGNTGVHDGSSWTNAFSTMQQALLYCADTIKIAAGTYLTSNSYRDSVFSIESGQVVLGGYPATGNPTDADRDPDLHHTILMGYYPAGSTGNFSPVLKAYNCDSTTLLDGIKASSWSGPQGATTAIEVAYGSKLKIMNCDFRIDITRGIRGTGLSIYDSSTAFIYRCQFNTSSSQTHGSAVGVGTNSHAVFTSCNFRGYTGPQNAITTVSVYKASATLDSCIFWKDNLHADVTFVEANASVLAITNCIFRAYNNDQPIVRTANNTTGTVTNSIFQNELSATNIPAVYNDNSHLIFNKCLFDSSKLVMHNVNRSSPVLNNCVSVNGKFMWNQRSFPIVNNCTILNNYFRSTLDITAREELVLNEDSSVFRSNNTIFWPAKLNTDKKDIYDRPNLVYPQNNSTSILTNCLTQNYGTHGQNGNIVGKTPRFHRPDLIMGEDRKLFTDDDGLQLAVCSPVVNAGNGALGTILSTDVLNNPRIVQAAVDMGAYELQQPANSAGTYYVNSTATGNNSGSGWTDAYPNLQTALCNVCADTIRVAAGTYKPAISARDSSFVIGRPLAMFGGYPATGNPVENERNAVKHPTILSGNIGDLTDSLDNTAMVVLVNGVTDSVHIDGFVIRDGYGVSRGIGINATGGAGINVLYTNTGIYNCQFINNHVFPYGGGCYIGSNSRATVSGCIFTGNSSTNEGGALYAGGYLRLTGSVFENNYSYAKGGGVAANAGIDISNSVFYRNYTTATNATGVGGGLYTAGIGNINNCSFVENKATSTSTQDLVGGGLYFDESLYIRVRNCLFSGNLAGNSTNSRGADLDWQNYNTVFNCIFQYARSSDITTALNIAANAGFEAVNDPKGPDGIWLTHDDGLQLHYASAAINHGLNAGVQDLPVDILGDDRIVLDTVDVGAYEYQNRPVAHAGADTLICTGNAVKIGREGNPDHIYNWTSSPVGLSSTSAAPVVSPSVPTTYFIEVSNGAEIARDTVEVAMSSSLQPTVRVVTANTSVCANAPITFTAIPVYGGTDPSYEWMVNGVKAGTDTAIYSTPVQDGDQVSVRFTSSASCASPAIAMSNVITMDVTPVAIPQVTVGGPISFCPGDTVTYTATPFDGGQRPLYKWVNGGLVVATTYSNTYTTNTITSQTNVYAMMFSNAVCQTKAGDTSNVLTIVPKLAVTPSVAVSASDATICGIQPVTFTAQAFSGGSNPLWQWKVNGNNVGANSNVYTNNSLVNGDKVYVVMTSSVDCARPPIVESNRVTMNVETAIIPTISITAPTEVPADTVVAVNANVMNGYGAVTYQWHDSTATHNWQTIPGAITKTVNYTPRKTGDKIRCVVQVGTNCGDHVTVQSEPVAFTVNTVTGINPVPAGNYGITSWPNPVNSYMVIDGLRLSDQWQMLEITSIEGRQKILVQHITGQTQITLSTVPLKAGLYFVILRKKNGEMVYLKFVKG